MQKNTNSNFTDDVIVTSSYDVIMMSL